MIESMTSFSCWRVKKKIHKKPHGKRENNFKKNGDDIGSIDKDLYTGSMQPKDTQYMDVVF